MSHPAKSYEMTLLWLLSEQKTAAGDAVLQWDCLYSDALVLIYHCLLRRVNVVKVQWVLQTIAEEVELWLHKALQ